MHCQYGDTEAASRYIAGTLPQDEALAFEEHCFTCEACAGEVEAGTAIRLALRPPRRRRWIPLAAAAAVVAMVFVLVPRDSPETMRGTAPAIVVNALAQGEEVRVEWPPVKGAARYVVTLSGEDGTRWQQTETAEPRVVFRAAPRAPAFVTVRALSKEGEEIARSRPQRAGP